MQRFVVVCDARSPTSIVDVARPRKEDAPPKVGGSSWDFSTIWAFVGWAQASTSRRSEPTTYVSNHYVPHGVILSRVGRRRGWNILLAERSTPGGEPQFTFVVVHLDLES